jgi:hypothetical protein
MNIITMICYEEIHMNEIQLEAITHSIAES